MIAHAQCALANNVEHFKMVLESVSCTEEDLLFTDAETGTDADAEIAVHLNSFQQFCYPCTNAVCRFERKIKQKMSKKHVHIQCNRQSNVVSQKINKELNVFTVFRLSINMSTEK